MAATIYSPPEEIGEPPNFEDFRKPDGRFDIEAELEAEEEYVQKIIAWTKEHSNSKLAGEIFCWPMGDGQAQYVVYTTTPLALIHCPIGDAWNIPNVVARGLRVSDIKQYAKQRAARAELFGKSNRRRG